MTPHPIFRGAISLHKLPRVALKLTLGYMPKPSLRVFLINFGGQKNRAAEAATERLRVVAQLG